MRVAFIQNFFEELTGPLILCELLERQGHRVKFFLPERAWTRKLKAFSPEMVAMSVCTGEHPGMLETASWVKKFLDPAPLVVMGGPHPTFFPEVIEHPCVDAICRGEGENAFPAFAASINGKGPAVDVDGFWIKREGRVYKNPPAHLVEDLDQIPIPSRKNLFTDYPFIQKLPFRKMITGRGCPYNCSYCYNRALKDILKGKGRYLRRRSVTHVVDEAAYLKRTFGTKFIDFNDDIFTVDPDWILEFSDQYASRVKVPFCCNVRVDRLDEQGAKALARAGCRVVKFGLESGDEYFRRTVLNKSTTDDDIRRCAEILHAAGMKIQTYNMLGLPGETLQQAMKTVRLNQEIKPYYAWCSLAQPYPGTAMAEQFAQAPEQVKDQVEHCPASWFDTSIAPLEDRERLINLHKFFALLVRFPKLEPLVMKLVELPENGLFRAVYQAVYGLHMKAMVKASWPRVLSMYLKLRKQY
ncbi:B12-binding domain-containing radical SAM protein [Desulfatibacillum aliphaticivorans]|uniref:B12-binding domain-containing radical SAM protein n=1 Tax=Desulfatibacillum aliphaticivorans TaxID=218208 RepID=UPI000427E1FD|nr:radical SAM protein [Desulfatibacillum aliphaticivorans]